MRPVPIPDDVLAEFVAATGGNAHRVVLGEPDPTRLDVRPAEYVMHPSKLFPGRPCYTALVKLSDEDRAAIIAGADVVVLTLDGAEVPWSLAVVGP